MTIMETLKEAEKAFHNMEWEKLVEINRQIIAKKPDKKVESLANGFYYYALAKLEKEEEKVISDLEKAVKFFKSVDSYLESLAAIERLILLSEFDKKNRPRHFLDLAELTRGLFIKTGDLAHLRLAMESFKRAKPFFRGKELERIILGLQFCCGTYAPHSESPEGQYTEVIRLCEEIKIKDPANLARSKINAANAHHNLAFMIDYPLDSIKLAIKLNEEAIEIFRELNSKHEIARAKQSLANVLRDASGIDTENGAKHLKKAIMLKIEVVDLFLQDEFYNEAGYEDLDIGTIYFELATCDHTCSDENLKNAVNHFNTAGKTFMKEKCGEGLGHAKAGIAAVYRNQGAFEDAALVYEEAIKIFKNPVFLGRIKKNLSEIYRDIAKNTGKKSHLKKAEKLEREAAGILKHS